MLIKTQIWFIWVRVLNIVMRHTINISIGRKAGFKNVSVINMSPVL